MRGVECFLGRTPDASTWRSTGCLPRSVAARSARFQLLQRPAIAPHHERSGVRADTPRTRRQPRVRASRFGKTTTRFRIHRADALRKKRILARSDDRGTSIAVTPPAGRPDIQNPKARIGACGVDDEELCPLSGTTLRIAVGLAVTRFAPSLLAVRRVGRIRRLRSGSLAWPGTVGWDPDRASRPRGVPLFAVARLPAHFCW